jgi:hypothetical protein
LKQKGELRLDAGVLVHRGGQDGPVIQPGKSAESELVKRLTATDEDERMPPEGKPLAIEQVNLLKNWIDSGAPYPKEEKVPPLPTEHWAFQVVRRPDVPTVKTSGGFAILLTGSSSRNSKLAAGSRPEAAPTPCCAAFISTSSDFRPLSRNRTPSATAGLSSAGPSHRRPWPVHHTANAGRATGSTSSDMPTAMVTSATRREPFVWRYCDYVIRALNADKPYDRFVMEQLAGDELPDANAGNLYRHGLQPARPLG